MAMVTDLCIFIALLVDFRLDFINCFFTLACSQIENYRVSSYVKEGRHACTNSRTRFNLINR